MAPRHPTVGETVRHWTTANFRQFQLARNPVVWLLSPLVGVATGVAAIGFRLAIGVFQWPWLGTMTENVTEAAGRQPWWVILIAPAGVPHRFTNTGSGPFRSLDIHLSDHVITEWLDEEHPGH